MDPEILCAALEKYIFKTKFTESDKLEVLKNVGNPDFDSKQMIDWLMENTEDRFDLYAPSEKLMNDLEKLIDFPNNSEFLGLKDVMNYKAKPTILTDTKGRKFISKSDIFLKVYEVLKTDENITNLLLQSFGNKIYRKLRNVYELVPAGIIDEILLDLLKYEDVDENNENGFVLSKYTVNEMGLIYSKFYDKNNDEKLLNCLRDELIKSNEINPIRDNVDFYHEIYLKHIHISKTMKKLLVRFSLLKSKESSGILRIIKDISGNKFVFAKELQIAIGNKKNIEIETIEQRKNGIVLLIEMRDVESIISDCGLSFDDFHIYEISIENTSRNSNVPIMSPYGTSCRLAYNSFVILADVFSTELRWFDTVTPKNMHKIDEWYISLSDVFDSKIRSSYLIETQKLDKLIEEAHKLFAKYVGKPDYDIPRNSVFSNFEQMRDEIKRLSTNLEVQDVLLYFNVLQIGIKFPCTKNDVFLVYNDYRCVYMMNIFEKFFDFFGTQHGINNFTKVCNQLAEKSLENETENGNNSENTLKVLKLDELIVQRFDAFKKWKPRVYLKLLRKNDYDGLESMNKICFFDNQTCFMKVLDDIMCVVEEYREIFNIFIEDEIEKFEKSSKIFYLTKEEYMKMSDLMKEEFEEILEESCEEFDEELVFDKKIQMLCRKFSTSELIRIKKVQHFFEEFSIRMKSLKDFDNSNGRMIILRSMCEIKLEDQQEWHIFSEEVLEAIEVVLENDGKLDDFKDQIEKWRKAWISEDGTFSIIKINLFETILESILQIDKSRFVIVPDIEYSRNIIELPLQMGYHAMSILSPKRTQVYHQFQAQFLIFQFGACDIFWHKEYCILKKEQKSKIMSEMKQIGKGYITAEKLEDYLKEVKYSNFVQKTPLSLFCEKSIDEKLSKKRLKEIYASEIIDYLDSMEYSNIFLKVNILNSWIYVFFNQEDMMKMKENIMNAVYFVSPVYLKNPKNPDIKSDMMGYEPSVIYPFISKSYEMNDGKDFLDKHYIFDKNDPLEISGIEKIMKYREAETIEKLKNDVISKIAQQIAEDVFEPVENLRNLVKTAFSENFDEKDSTDLIEKMSIYEYFPQLEFSTIDGVEMYKKKKKEIKTVKVPKKRREKKKSEESGKKERKVLKKCVVEKRIVESCEKCENFEEEEIERKMIIEEFDEEKIRDLKFIVEKQEELSYLKNELMRNKLKYREEVQSHKEDVEIRDIKLLKLAEKLRESRENTRIGREQMYLEFEENSKKSAENLRKIEIELESFENLSILKKSRISELMAENEKLKNELENCV